MSKQRLIQNFDDKFQQLGYLNKQRSVLLVKTKEKQNAKTYLVKLIHLGESKDSKNLTGVPQSMLKRLYGSSLPMIHKPDNYSFVQRNKHFYIYLISQILQLSLESIILYHRKRGQRINPSITFDFGSKIYDMLVRIKNVGDSNHKNLKPSNIFLTISSDGQLQWKISEYGLMTNFPNKYYQIANRDTNRSKTNISFINEQYEGDLFSLAVILIEMMTLAPIHKIYYNLRKQSSLRSLDGFQMAKAEYGNEIVDFIYQLMSPKDNIKDIYRKFRDNPPQYSKIQRYQQIKMNEQRFRKIIEQRPFEDAIQKFKKQVQYVNIQTDDVIKKAEQYDPDLQFHFFDYKPMMLFLHEFKIDFSQDRLINFCFFMRSQSAMNYIDIVKHAFPARALIQSVIKRAILTYQYRRQFFQVQSGGSQYWKAEDIHKFLQSLGVFIEDKNVSDVVIEWAGTKTTSIQYKQFNKIFRNVGEQDVSNLRSNTKTNRNETGEKGVQDLLNQLNNKLQSDGKNIVSFFREQDKKQKWYVEVDIQDQIRKYTKIQQKQLRDIFQDMWRIAGQTDKKGRRILNYITLIKKQMKDTFPLPQLFKTILVQKINDTERKAFYKKYEKDEKGWNKNSLISFSQDQMLQFDQRQLNAIFNAFDDDKSGYLCQKQLMFKLTGLVQFDKDFIVDKIKQEIGPGKKWDMFEVFVRFDQNSDLLYDSPGQLVAVFQHLNIDIPPEHCSSLFTNGMTKSKKFPYLTFLRYFVTPKQLFIKTCMWCIDKFYNGKFQKFYEIGRVQNKKKWSRQSLNRLNEQLILGFKSDQIGQVWEDISHGEQAITRQQVAKAFNTYCPTEQDILPIQSTQKPKYETKEERKTYQKNQKQQKRDTPSPSTQNDGKQKNQLANQLFQKKLTDVALCFVRKSKQNGELSYHQFCECLDQLKVKYVRGAPMKSTRRFQTIDSNSDSTKINYFNYLMYVCQLKQEDKQMRKAQCLAIILKQLMRFYNKTVQEVFSKCRKPGTMKLSEYQNFIRDMIKTEVYFDDIEDTWKYWGEPEYLTPQDFKKILNDQSINDPRDRRPPKIPLKKQFSFAAQQETIRQSTGQQSAQSPYFQKRIGRRQSQDKRQLQKQSEKDKQSNFDKNKKQKQKQRQLQERERERQREKQKQRQRERQKKLSTHGKKKQQQTPKPSIQDRTQKQITKTRAVEIFEEKLQQKGSQKLNNLFSKSNSVSPQYFASFVESHFGMSTLQCQKLAQALSSFGKIKIQTIKKYIKKIQSPKKIQKQDERRILKPDPSKKQDLKRRQNEKGKTTKQQPVQNQNLRLQDPKKLKINVPLVKQHIKILINSFARKFDVSQIEPYFFEGNTVINKQDFISKCMGINSAISKTMYEKIFLFLKPKTGFVSTIDFNLNFSLDKDNLQIDETYLPDQIQQQIKIIFEKADKDKSGYVQISEIQILLSSMGFNETQKQIQNYFQKIDQNFDKKISLKQFKSFIQDNILPYISDFDEEVDGLNQLLKMNDVFRTGFLPVSTVGALLQRYGVKIGQKDLQALHRGMANQNGQISIKQLLNVLYYPSQPSFPSSLKSVLYKIRWRRKITLKQVQKIFENISTCFVNSYSSMQIKHKILKPSTFITPILNQSRLFYNDFYYKNANRLQLKLPNLINQQKQNDLIVQIKLIDAYGIPIPQNPTIKSQILNRSVNIIFYDTSVEQGKDCITNLQIQFDGDVEDQWVFNKNNRSIFVKIGNYQARKFQKLFILFQFIVTLVDGNKCLDISCGTASFPVKQLLVDSKVTKKYKIIAGLPNKSKDIDKMSVSKRKGWRGFIGSGQMQSQFQIQMVPSSKFLDKLPYMCAMPQKSIINRKALHLFWVFRQYFAYRSIDQKRVNPDIGYHFLVKTFLLCLDVPDVYQELFTFWKQRIQSKASMLDIARRIFQTLMQDLYIVMNSKQFQILPSFPSKSTLNNKNLKSIRKKLLQEVFTNIQDWVNIDVMKEYKRKRAYGVDTMPFKIQQRQLNDQARYISEQIVKSR